MQELKVIGVEEGALLVASDEGARFRVAVDDVLQSRLRQSSPDLGASRKLSPREIQAHIRAGMSAAVAVRTTRGQAVPPGPERGYLWHEQDRPNDLVAQRWGVIAPEGPEGDELLAAIEPALDEAEAGVVRRARNLSHKAGSRGVRSTRDYRSSTALEALVAHWCVCTAGRPRFDALVVPWLEARIELALATKPPRRG